MLVNNLDVSGGYQKLVLRFTRELISLGHTVTVYTGSFDREACYPELISEVEVCSPRLKKNHFFHNRFVIWFLGPIVDVIKFRSVGKLVSIDVDALFVHDELSLYGLGSLDLDRNIPVVWMLNNELSQGIKSLTHRLTFRASQFGSLRSALAHLLHYPALILEWFFCRSALRRVDVAAVYDERNKEVVSESLQIPTINVCAGADVDHFSSLRDGIQVSRVNSPLRLLSVGVMFPHRRYEDIVNAVAIAKKRGVDVQLTIVGRCDLHLSYAQFVKKLTLEIGCSNYVTFKEVVTDVELIQLYREADAFVFVNDGLTWGISVFEAVAANIPVVITSNIGAADLLVDRSSAWIVPPRSPEAIAEALCEIKTDPLKVAAITSAAKRHTLPIVSWGAYTQRMLDTLKWA
jgi:glycosyltransferase involved in cell wall biosynthesis